MGENPNQLTGMTLELLHALTNQVKVVVFWSKETGALDFYGTVSALLNEYQLATTRITVEYVDQTRNPTAAMMIKDHYKLTLPGEDFARNVVIFDGNGKIKTVYEKELYDLDISGAMSGQTREIKRTHFKGELMFTSALVEVTDPKRYKVYFLQGHKEHHPKDDNLLSGYSKFAALLQQLNIQVEDQLFLSETNVPTDCQLLIIAGPKERLAADELAKIEQYLNRGGRVLALFNYQAILTPTGLEKLFSNWGVRVGADWVLDPEAYIRNAKMEYINALVITNFPASGHPIMKKLLRARLGMSLPRTVERQPLGKADADSPKVEELAAASYPCLAVTNFLGDVPHPDPLRDRRGPIPLIVAVEKGSVQGITADRGVTRMVVIGDSVCFNNQMIDFLANRDFAVLSVNWLLDRSKLMGGIGPRAVKEFRLVMTPSQLFAVRWILLAAFPGAILALGGLAWFRRRK